MNRNLQSQTKLTEFAPLSPEQEEGSGIGYLFYRFFRRPAAEEKTDESADSRGIITTGNGNTRKDVTTKESSWEEPAPKKQTFVEEEEESLDLEEERRTGEARRLESEEFRLDVSEGRSLPNVLKRISNLLAVKNTGGGRRSYNDTELKQYWMPDSVSKECYDCGERFTTFRRRHHCRVCGQIFCARCCNQEIPGKIMNCTGDLRVCMYCGKVVLSYVQSADMSGELSSDLRALHQELHFKFGGGGHLGGGEIGNMDGGTSSGMTSPPGLGGDSSTPLTPLPVQPLGPSPSLDNRDEPIKRKHSLGYREEKFAFARSNSETGTGGPERSRGWLRGLMDEAVAGLGLDSPQASALAPSAAAAAAAGGGGALHLHRHRLHRAYTGSVNHQSQSPCLIDASQLIHWLVQHGKANNRIEGVALGQAMVNCGYLEPLESGSQFFETGCIYRVVPASLTSVPHLPEEDIKQDSSADSESEFLSSETNLPTSNSIFNLNLNLEEKTAHLSKPYPQPAAQQEQLIKPSDTDTTDIITNTHSSFHSSLNSTSNHNNHDNSAMNHHRGKKEAGRNRSSGESVCEIGVRAMVEAYQQQQQSGGATTADNNNTLPLLEPVHWNDIQPESLSSQHTTHKQAYNTLRSAFDQHLANYLRQLLMKEGVSQSWANIISTLCQHVVKIVKPDYSRIDEMDIRQYVQFKKVSGGDRSECEIVKGVVCSKNVAHRAMPTAIVNPKILLLSCPIVYQRVEGKFLSLEPVIMQEQDYIGHTVARIAALGADLVVVGRNVSRLAQEALLGLGMSLVLNVKPTVLERLARATSADILTSVDSHVGRPKLGTCALFHLRTFNIDPGRRKTLMVVEGCPVSELGCTVLLRGATVEELSKIKRIAQSMLFAEYNAALEFSYLLDAHASPPSPPVSDTFFTEDPPPDPADTGQNPPQPATAQGGLPTPEGVQDPSSKRLPPPAGVKVRDRLSSEERMKAVNCEAVSDFSDPLRSYWSVDEDSGATPTLTSQGDHPNIITHPPPQSSSLAVTELPLSNKFRKALEDNILSISPYLKFTLPYLESESGRHCALRSYFGQKLYWSAQLYEDREPNPRTASVLSDTTNPQSICSRYENIKLKEEHKFVREHLTEPAESVEVRTLLAEFRACGGRIPYPGMRRDNNLLESSFRGGRVPQPPHAVHHPHHGVVTRNTSSSMDVLDVDNHQTLSVLFCSYSPISHNAPTFCVDPWVVDMELYGRNDIPVGAFLERYCFRREYVCPSDSCDVAMLHHTRRFVHDGGAVHVALRHLPILDHPTTDPLPQHDNILMWTCCTHCNTVTPIVAMSPATWRLSFAKYLELRFHGNMYTVQAITSPACPHSLHHNHAHYFSHKNILASFTYRKISVWEISLPPVTLETEREMMRSSALLEEMKTWSLIGQQAFSQVLNKLCSLPLPADSAVAAMKLQLQKDQAHFKSRVEEVQAKISALPNENGIKGDTLRKIWSIEDGMVNVKRLVAEMIDDWNGRLSEADAALLATSQQTTTRKKPPPPSTNTNTKDTSSIDKNKTPANPDAKQAPHVLSDILDGVSVGENDGMGGCGKESPDLVEAEEATPSSGDTQQPSQSSAAADNTQTPPSDPLIDPIVIHPHQCEMSGSNVDVRHCVAPPDKKTVKTILSQLLPTAPQNTYIQSPMSQCEHYCLGGGWLLPVVVYEREPSSIIAYALTSHDYRTTLDEILTASNNYHPATTSADNHHHHPPPSPSAKQRSGSNIESVVTTSKDVVTDCGGGRSCGEMMVGGGASSGAHHINNNHTTNPTTATTNVSGFLRNSNASSVGNDMKNSGGGGRRAEGSSEGVHVHSAGLLEGTTPGSSFVVPPVNSITSNHLQATSTSDDDPTNKPTMDDTKTKPNKNHQSPNIEVQFGDSCANFKVKVYFAEDFQRLRSVVLPHGEESFIRSLTRCVPWAATGGKSGSNFSKTKDDRFILKEMSRLETQLFIEFAPQYFTYMETCVRSRSPTLLGKIVGVYRVSYRNATNSYRSNLLVMEHLFHARLVTNKFDLKGSIRNRLVDTTSESERETVLLDENLINMTCDSPLYILPHSKTILMQAIHNDTQFLATQSVMDYSLLVGLDQSKKELVVGIIDYIRTFTWDKKLETMVKRYGLLGQGKQPTIISPDEYRERFIAAMHRYFLPVPDRWSRLANGIDC